ASGFAVLECPFNDEITKGEGEELFEFVKEGQAIVGGIRVDRIKFFHADALEAHEFGSFSNGIASRWKGLSNDSGDAHETVKVVGEVFPRVDEYGQGGHHGLGLALPGEHDDRSRAAGILAGSWALLSACCCGSVRLRRGTCCSGGAWRWSVGGRWLCRGIVSCARDRVAQCLIGLVDQLCAGFRLPVQCR